MRSTTKEQLNLCNKVVTILSADTTQWRVGMTGSKCAQ